MEMKPMLAAKVDNIAQLHFPLYASPKIDGIRCIVINGQALSRTLKPIPNHHIRSLLQLHKDQLEGFDGELKAGSTFQDVSSSVMSHDGVPSFIYCIFDHISSGSFASRYLAKPFPDLTFTSRVPQILIETTTHLEELESEYILQGYEGVMLRRADGYDQYKYGRSTFNEGYLLKLKRFEDDEATVVAFTEQFHNSNKLEQDERGYAKRSSQQEGMVPVDTLGALIVESPTFGLFHIGTGFTASDRATIWNNRSKYKGRLVKFKYQKCGTKDKPRIPVFLGFRDIIDI